MANGYAKSSRHRGDANAHALAGIEFDRHLRQRFAGEPGGSNGNPALERDILLTGSKGSSGSGKQQGDGGDTFHS